MIDLLVMVYFCECREGIQVLQYMSMEILRVAYIGRICHVALLIILGLFFSKAAVSKEVPSEVAADKAAATLMVGKIIEAAGQRTLSIAMVENFSGLSIQRRTSDGIDSEIEAISSLQLLSKVSVWERRGDDGVLQSQVVHVDFNLSPEGNRKKFLEECLSTRDVRQLLPSGWGIASVINPYRIRFARRFGEFMYSIYTNPNFSEIEVDCLKSLSIYYLVA